MACSSSKGTLHLPKSVWDMLVTIKLHAIPSLVTTHQVHYKFTIADTGAANHIYPYPLRQHEPQDDCRRAPVLRQAATLHPRHQPNDRPQRPQRVGHEQGQQRLWSGLRSRLRPQQLKLCQTKTFLSKENLCKFNCFTFDRKNSIFDLRSCFIIRPCPEAMKSGC